MAANRRSCARADAAAAALLLLCLCCSLLLPAHAAAQESVPTQKHRRWIYAAVGAVIGAVPTLIIGGELDRRGWCSSQRCVVGGGATLGALVGFMVGHEKDRVATLQAAAGPPLRLPTRSVPLGIAGETVVAFRGGALVVAREGVAIIDDDGAVWLRAVGMRGIQAAAPLPAHNALLLATPSGVFAFALRGDQSDGRLAVRDGAAALQPVSDSEMIAGGSELLRRLRVAGTGNAIETAEIERVVITEPFTDLAFAPKQGILWALLHDRVAAFATEPLRELGSVHLPVAGRALAVHGARAVVAAGRDGIIVLDIARADAPAVLGHGHDGRFFFDVALSGERAYLAAGSGGLVVKDISDPAHVRTTGAAPELGFIASVAIDAYGRVLAADQQGRRLRILEATTRAASSRER